MKSSRPGSAKWRSSKTITTGARRRQPLEERAPGAEQLLGADPGLDAQERQQRGLDPAPLGLGRGRGRRGSRRPSRGSSRSSSRLQQAGAAADHLAQRPEADPLAVGGRAAVVPPDVLDQAVDVLEELPGEAGLADARRPDDRDQPGPALAGGGVEQLLEQAQLVVAADERRLQRLRRGRARRARPTTRSARQAGTGAALPLSACSPAASNAMARDGRALGRLADEHRPGRRRPTGGGTRC